MANPAAPTFLSFWAMADLPPDRLSDLNDFGSNPGNLGARTYVPASLAADAPLVVVFHGGSQSAYDYDLGSGWSRLADKHGFALLFPEQRRANNPALCFNWYETGDNKRSSGEAASTRQMIEALVLREGLARGRVFVSGVSAGGAMAAVMMATYPEVFSGGAMIAGLPYGCAAGILQAMDRMHGLGGPSAHQLEAKVRAASTHDGPWPRLSLWHGTADRTVALSNIDAILGQWCLLHGLDVGDAMNASADGYPRRVWCDRDGREIIEYYSITGMGHGTPLETGGIDGYGRPGSYMLDVHISSTLRIARFWGIVPLLPISTFAAEVVGE